MNENHIIFSWSLEIFKESNFTSVRKTHQLNKKFCIPTEKHCNETYEFNCGDKCIPMSQVCNGNIDCENGADEPTDGSCGRNECEELNGGCTHYCEDTRAGHYCKCKPGYMLVNSTQCEGIVFCVLFYSFSSSCI